MSQDCEQQWQYRVRCSLQLLSSGMLYHHDPTCADVHQWLTVNVGPQDVDWRCVQEQNFEPPWVEFNNRHHELMFRLIWGDVVV